MENGFFVFESEIGKIFLESEDEFLTGLHFNADKDGKTLLTPVIEKTMDELSEYFKGKRKTFDIDLKFSGTEFQKKCWKRF